MLTANRYDVIRKVVRAWQLKSPDCVTTVGEALDMLVELAAEIDRMRTPAQVGGRGHLKPVILDQQGKAIAPPPLSQQFAHERREQYDADRFDAIMDASPDKWRVFSLRWGLTPPPGGWENTDAIMNVIHAVRLSVKAVPYAYKLASAQFMRGRGLQLPPGVTLINGELAGVELPE